jgi:predicted NAD/FAD-binding protein
MFDHAKVKKIAIIGAGVSGLTCAWLLNKNYEVQIFELERRAGGHTKTIQIDGGPDAGTGVDVGFIVMNDKTYPGFHALLKELAVEWRWSDMSFGYEDKQTGFSFAGRGFQGLFGKASDLIEKRRWQLYFEILRFSKAANNALINGMAKQLTMQEFCEHVRLSKDVLRSYILPMGAAIWSCPADLILNFPAEYFIGFFKNHGLLSLKDRPRWQTVVGGSHAYVKKITAALDNKLRLGSAVRLVERNQDGVKITIENNTVESYDAVIFACHANQVLPLLAAPSDGERTAFQDWRYERNEICLHTDISILPDNPNYWASWNFIRDDHSEQSLLRVTYDMNRLQGLKTQERYLVSLNCGNMIKEERKLAVLDFEHPHYDFSSLASQAAIPLLNGQQQTWFCGSYCGYGFHEDAVQSALRVCNDFGCTLKYQS